MRIHFGADDHNECTQAVIEHLRSLAEVQVFNKGSWPDFARTSGEPLLLVKLTMAF
jgi:hypothetical protein